MIDNEVTCRINDLDAQTRKELVKKFEVEIPHARYMPAVRLGRWNGKKPFFALGGATYINLLPEIVEYLTSLGYEINLDDQRTAVQSFEFDAVNENSYAEYSWPEGHQNAGDPIVLRDYQVDIINNFFRNPQCLGEIATGSGKTLITASLSKACERYGRTIVVVPNKSLVLQTERDYRLLNLNVGVWFGERKELNKTHTICTWQSLGIMMKKSRDLETFINIGEFLKDVVAVIVDEAHSAKAQVLTDVLCGPMRHIPIRWGITGTIPKELFDKMSLRVAIGEVVHKLSAADLQDRGVLSNCHVYIKQLVDFGEYRNYAEEVTYLTTDSDRLSKVAETVRAVADTGSTLLLVNRIETGRKLQEFLPDFSFISGSTKMVDRKKHYDEVDADYATNIKNLIATYGVAAVGINLVGIRNLILFEPGKSFVRVIQSIGRGLRKGFDKDHVDIFDVTSTLKFSKRHLTKRKTYYNEAGYPYTVEKIN